MLGTIYEPLLVSTDILNFTEVQKNASNISKVDSQNCNYFLPIDRVLIMIENEKSIIHPIKYRSEVQFDEKYR